METAFAELPLAVFTTLAPIGAAGFFAFAITTCTAQPTCGQAQKDGKLLLAPFIVALAGFCASALHLANPLKAAGVAAGIGSSPLTNEVLVGGLFMLVAFVYTALVISGKIGAAKKPLAVVTGALAVVFCLFVGLAYMLPTVSSWNTWALPVQIVGYALVGGCAFGALTIACDNMGSSSDRTAGILRIVAACGAVASVAAGAVQLAGLSSMTTAVASGSSILAVIAPFAIVGMALVVIAAAELWLGLDKKATQGTALRAALECIVGVFLIRLAFYAMYLSAGTTLM